MCLYIGMWYILDVIVCSLKCMSSAVLHHIRDPQEDIFATVGGQIRYYVYVLGTWAIPVVWEGRPRMHKQNMLSHRIPCTHLVIQFSLIQNYSFPGARREPKELLSTSARAEMMHTKVLPCGKRKVVIGMVMVNKEWLCTLSLNVFCF